MAVGRGAQLMIEAAESLYPVEQAGEVGAPGPALHHTALVVANIGERAVARGDQQQEGAQALHQITRKLAQVGPLVGHAIHGAQRGAGVAIEQRVDQGQHLGGRRHAEQAMHLLQLDRAAGVRGQLLQHAQSVAHAARGGAGDRLGHALL